MGENTRGRRGNAGAVSKVRHAAARLRRSRGSAAALEPSIAPSVLGAVLFEEGASVHPKLVLASLKRAVETRGGNLLEGTPVLSLMVDGDRVRGVETSLGPVTGDVVILAAGAWSQTLVQPLHMALPVVPLKGQMCCLPFR